MCGGIFVSSEPSLFLFIDSGLFPRDTFGSIGSRSGSIEGLVTCDALIRILSQYTGRSTGLPIEERRAAPVAACLYTSVIVCALQFPLGRNVWSLLTIFSA